MGGLILHPSSALGVKNKRTGCWYTQTVHSAPGTRWWGYSISKQYTEHQEHIGEMMVYPTTALSVRSTWVGADGLFAHESIWASGHVVMANRWRHDFGDNHSPERTEVIVEGHFSLLVNKMHLII